MKLYSQKNHHLRFRRMLQICVIYLLVLFLLTISWKYTGVKIKSNQKAFANISSALILVIIISLRDGSSLPDYQEYVNRFKNGSPVGMETTFNIIVEFSKSLGGSSLIMFMIYSVISVTARLFAIVRFSPFILYSLSVWASTFMLLHDMIQIRAAVAGSLLLVIIPMAYQRKYLASILLCILAFLFHRSAIIFFPLLFIPKDTTKWLFWLSFLLVFIILNACRINILGLLGLDQFLSGIQLIEGDIYAIRQSDNMVNMFAPLTFIQITTVLLCIWRYDIIRSIFPAIGIFLKISIIGLIIYSLSIPVVSTRLSELISSVYIFIYPCALLWYKGKYKSILGKLSVTLICLFILTNYIFKQHFIIY